MSPQVHPSAVIDPGALLAEGVDVGPFCVVGGAVEIGAGTRLMHSVTVTGRTRIGARNVFYPYSVVGGDPQDLKYRGEDSETLIGDENTIRESVTINKGTAVGGNRTVLGHRNLLMACSHVAHDSLIGDNTILANQVLLAGHSRIEDSAIVSGHVALVHFVTVGRHAFIGGKSGLNQDAPPFMVTQGVPARVIGVNTVGLRRRGFSAEAINALREAHRIIWRSGAPRSESIAEVEQIHGAIPEIRELVEFLRASDRGRLGRARESERSTPVVPGAEPELVP